MPIMCFIVLHAMGCRQVPIIITLYYVVLLHEDSLFTYA